MDAPTTPTPPTLSRRSLPTRLALAATLFLIALTLAGWAFSHSRILTASRKFGSIVAPGASDGEPDSWTFRARTLRLAQFPGELSLGLSEYRSLASTPDELDTWKSWRGWSADMFPSSAITPDSRPAMHWNSPADFAFLGLGSARFLRQGEDTRLISIPHWLLALTLATLALALWFPAHRYARRLRNNQCPRCAYDRSATPHTAPCPECGHTRP